MDKAKIRNDALVGLLVLSATVLLMLVTFLARADLFGGQIFVPVAFQDAEALEFGAPIYVAGIRKGRVSNIRFVNPDEYQDYFGEPYPGKETATPILLTMKINDDIQVYSNATVTLAGMGFIGDKVLKLTPGSPEGGTLMEEDSAPLVGTPPFDPMSLADNAETMMQDLQSTIASIRTLVEDESIQTDFRETVANVNDSMARLNFHLETHADDIEAIIGSVRTVSEDLQDFTADLDRFTREGGEIDTLTAGARELASLLRQDVTRLSDRADNVLMSVESAITDFKVRYESLSGDGERLMESATSEFESVSSNFSDLTSDLRSVINRIEDGDGTLGLLLNDPAPFLELKKTLESINRILGGSSIAVSAEIPYEAQPEEPAQP